MKKSSLKAYHGSPVRIERFDYGFTEKGSAQFLGSGFYFSTLMEDALSYASEETAQVTAGLEISPTLHTVELVIKNPLPSDFDGVITLAQARELISIAPRESRDDGLWEWGDIANEPIPSVINRAAKAYAGEQTVLKGLHNISNDFYRDEPKAFNEAVLKVLGYDGVRHQLQDGKNYHFVAWFPEQITIIARQSSVEVVKQMEATAMKLGEGCSPSP